ncbi:MAG: hypothetical protein J7527_12490, partial [Chitinophagaceae bacterium]|nr:hypothetical protein [Chitinophagaceae bacterium]
MKVFFISLVILFSLSSATPAGPVSQPPIKVKPAQNLIIVTIDGFRWQELFGGADEQLISNEKYTADAETMKTLYWA